MYQNINVDYLKYCCRIFFIASSVKCLKVRCSNIYLCCQYCQNCHFYTTGFVLHFKFVHLHKMPTLGFPSLPPHLWKIPVSFFKGFCDLCLKWALLLFLKFPGRITLLFAPFLTLEEALSPFCPTMPSITFSPRQCWSNANIIV